MARKNSILLILEHFGLSTHFLPHVVFLLYPEDSFPIIWIDLSIRNKTLRLRTDEFMFFLFLMKMKYSKE